MNELTPELVVSAYLQGAFPMAQSSEDSIDWYVADPRAILPLDAFHMSHSLRQRLRRGEYHVTLDHAFEKVITGCAKSRHTRPSTWINQQIIDVYTQLHHMGIGHSVEAWDHQGELVGGLYGLSMGGAFFGESMFSTRPDASKVCLVKLVEHMRDRGYILLDAQIGNEHMLQFGQIEIPLTQYMEKLEEALKLPVSWARDAGDSSTCDVRTS